ncbi:pyridine nucleotide-disulfide oxidoreductase domain-containing protein 2-like [Ylistrum balloti]|uniref:pyridine nucleotide-disulfide oxidoreductase domain-containing protein 2-like n=1 Tax=Ylistrum balloti TaxID=509963 RepID=UPI0029059B7E|nr:pyridine nucleotide-disulfide oxidoreductase domain-containing protein 2-like [Ylistrum balloti]
MAFRGKLKGIYGKISKGAIQKGFSYRTAATKSKCELKSKYDVVIIGAGHNGLVSAAYLQEAGLSVCVVERRHVIGGAAVTEEVIPGFKFSRASYVLSLLRPQIMKDLQLKKYGLEVYLRDPSSYTPLLTPGGRDGKAKSLLLHRDSKKTAESIAQFSQRDAKSWFEYEKQLEHIVSAIEPLMDSAPIHLPTVMAPQLLKQVKSLPAIFTLLKSSLGSFRDTSAFYELMTAPTTKILDKWFESEPLKATLATDSVIGAMISPKTPGSGYVLLHHVMGELERVKGAWGIVKGGMGAVSQSIANCAVDRGASIFTDSPVQEIVTNNNSVKGVVLQDGTAIEARAVLSNATPKVTFLDLLPAGNLSEDMMKELRNFDYTSPVTKINVAVKELPNFVADPNIKKNEVMPHHRATIHLNCEHSDLIHDGFLEAQAGKFSSKPMIEMVIPTSLDPTMAPPGCHVCLLFTQYTPYHLAEGQEWDDHMRNRYADTVFDDIEKYAPGFKASVVGRDILTPPDLEKTFNLTGGNIFHGTMGLDQLYMSRPISKISNYRSPVEGLYLCGSGAHPGGGVMGSAGRLAAITALSDLKTL